MQQSRLRGRSTGAYRGGECRSSGQSHRQERSLILANRGLDNHPDLKTWCSLGDCRVPRRALHLSNRRLSPIYHTSVHCMYTSVHLVPNPCAMEDRKVREQFRAVSRALQQFRSRVSVAREFADPTESGVGYELPYELRLLVEGENLRPRTTSCDHSSGSGRPPR